MRPPIRGFPGTMRPARPRSRFGCLGCLPQVFFALALGVVLMLAITAIFAPWGFYLGGQFHIIPYWQGFGTLHAKSGKYVVFIRFEPKPSGSKIYPAPTVGGIAYLCSPRGEKFRMNLGGGMRRGIGKNTDGEKISFYAHYWPIAFGNFTTDHRPGIELRGQWKNPNIEMDDHGSIYRAFNPDGTVFRGGGPEKPYNGEVVPVTLAPGSYSDFEAACKTP
jgi:hypothetical protein